MLTEHRQARRRRSLAGVIAYQAVVLAAVITYLASGGPLAPDNGLQQLDMITLDEPVAGVGAQGDRATLVLVPGPLDEPRCAALLRDLIAARGTGDGLSQEYGLVVAAARRPDGPLGDAAFLPDPDGAIARSLALPDAATRCRPGYALVDPTGNVRYRTYDPAYPEHPLEQMVLLADLQGRRR